MKQLIFLIVILYLINSCSLHNKKIFFQKNNYKNLIEFNILINQFSNNIVNIWGINRNIINVKKKYIFYTNNNNLKSYINFVDGYIIIEAFDKNNFNIIMKKEIIRIILSSKYSKKTKSSNIINKTGKNLLFYGYILDNQNKPIRWYKEAYIFANYLVKNKIKIHNTYFQKTWSIHIPLSFKYLDRNIYRYLPIVQKASKKYNVNKSLILAIIQIESSFKPNAVSNSDAVGLMQIVKKTAGADVFRLKGKFGEPSRNYLLNPEKNIDIGVAYLSILQDNYLSEIINPVSRLYAVITAYHGGVNSVLKTFSENKEFAFRKINSISPQKVYQKLINKHPSVETRKYLYKVNKIKTYYSKYL